MGLEPFEGVPSHVLYAGASGLRNSSKADSMSDRAAGMRIAGNAVSSCAGDASACCAAARAGQDAVDTLTACKSRWRGR